MADCFSQGRAVLIGIANYSAVRGLPSIVSKDARDIADLLQSPNHGGYPSGHITLLTDRDATADGIRAALAQLAGAADKNDTVVVYFSGHGGRVLSGADAGTYLIPYDCEPSNLRGTAISSDEFTRLLSSIPANRVVVLLDACHSAGAGELKDLTPNGELKAGLDEKTYNSLADGVGRVFMASSRATEYSLVLPGINNSLFTHYLLEAMKGGAPSHGDGLIRVFDVFHYVSDKVPAHAREVNRKQQPVFKAHDVENNFPLALDQGGKGESRLALPLAPRPKALSGPTKVLLIRRLVDRWSELATYFEIPPADQARFPKGDEPRSILLWLEQRNQLSALRDAFNFLGWDDLIFAGFFSAPQQAPPQTVSSPNATPAPQGNPSTDRLIRKLQSIQLTGLQGTLYVEIVVQRPEGRYEIVPDGGRIRTKVEPYRVYVYVPSDGYLYVCQVDSGGRVAWLFPKNESKYSYGRNPVKGGDKLMIPDNVNGLKLDEVTGKESVIVIFSPEKWEDFEGELRAAATDQSSVVRPEQPVLVRVGVMDDPPRGVGGEIPFAGSNSLAELEEQMYRQAKLIPVKAGAGRMVETRWFEHVD
jgi:metacaspase-1